MDTSLFVICRLHVIKRVKKAHDNESLQRGIRLKPSVQKADPSGLPENRQSKFREDYWRRS